MRASGQGVWPETLWTCQGAAECGAQKFVAIVSYSVVFLILAYFSLRGFEVQSVLLLFFLFW